MGPYILRRLLIAVPSLLGISVVLFTVLALAPGDPFGELALNPNVPAEVRQQLRKSSGSTTRSGSATSAGWRRCCRATGASRSSAASTSTR